MTRVAELERLCRAARHPLEVTQDATSVAIIWHGLRLVSLRPTALENPSVDLPHWVEEACLSVDDEITEAGGNPRNSPEPEIKAD